MAVEEVPVGRQVAERPDLHPALDAAQHGGPLVVPEVVSASLVQQLEDIAQGLLGRCGGRRPTNARNHLFRVGQLHAPGVLPEVDQAIAHVGRRQDDIDLAGGHGVLRHVAVLRIGRCLRQHDTALFLQPRDACRPVGPRAGEDDADRSRAVRVGERPEEVVDDDMPARRTIRCGDAQAAIEHRQVEGRRNDVDVVTLDVHGARHLRDRHPRRGLQDRRRIALVLRREMEDHDERHVRRGGQALEQGLDGGQATGGCTDADDRKVEPAGDRPGIGRSIGS